MDSEQVKATLRSVVDKIDIATINLRIAQETLNRATTEASSTDIRDISVAVSAIRNMEQKVSEAIWLRENVVEQIDELLRRL